MIKIRKDSKCKLNLTATISKECLYVGIIAFIAYLAMSLIMWIIDVNKEADNIVNNAKAELAPLIQWYEKDSTNELESIENLTKESLNVLKSMPSFTKTCKTFKRRLQMLRFCQILFCLMMMRIGLESFLTLGLKR